MPEEDATEPGCALAAWRDRVPLLERAVPMNACSQGPLTDRAEEALSDFTASWRRRGMDWERWLREVERARGLFADLIGAEPGEVAVAGSVSGATNSVASALDFGGGRRTVVVTGAEFPSVAHCWLSRRRDGARIEWIPLRD
ncbi:MAG: aminotransferase class V-fold PLP-dependent enzyme, partial [Gemmatimonadota bacterium]